MLWKVMPGKVTFISYDPITQTPGESLWNSENSSWAQRRPKERKGSSHLGQNGGILPQLHPRGSSAFIGLCLLASLPFRVWPTSNPTNNLAQASLPPGSLPNSPTRYNLLASASDVPSAPEECAVHLFFTLKKKSGITYTQQSTNFKTLLDELL